jgi:hypothetical protein
MSLISSSYNKESLELIKQDTTLDWDKYPVKISSNEMETIKNVPHVLKILSGKSQSPSDLIGLKEEDILSPTIDLINNEYEKAIDSYKSSLKDASKLDDKNIKQLKDNRSSNFWGSYTIGGGVGGLAGVGAGALSGL